MNYRTTYVLFGILACLFVFLGLALWLAPLPTQANQYVFPSLHPREGEVSFTYFDHVEIEHGDVAPKLVFDRDNKTNLWTVSDGTATYPADSAKVNRLISAICGAKKVPTEKPPALGEWGLDKPDTVVTMKSSDGKHDIKLSIGKSSPGDDRSAVTYVLSSEYGQDPLAVSRAVASSAMGSLPSFRDRELLAGSAPDIESIDMTGKVDGKEQTVALKKVEERWQFTAPFQGDAQSEGTDATPEQPIKTVTDLTTALANLNVEFHDDRENDFVADNVSDWKKYFLDPAKFDVLHIKVKDVISNPTTDDKSAKTEKTVTLLVALKEKVGDKKDKYYVRIEGQNSVYRVSAKAVDRILEVLKDPSSLRDRHLVKLSSFKRPDVIQIKEGNQTLDFRQAGEDKPWMMYRGDTAIPVDPLVIRGLLDKLLDQFPTMEFPPLDNAAVLGVKDADSASVVVSLWINGLESEPKDTKEPPAKKPELKKDAKDKPTYTLYFGKTVTGKQGEKLVAVKRLSVNEKTATLMEVPVVVLERVQEGPLFYYLRTLPQFNPNLPAELAVTRLTIEDKGKTIEVAREKDGAPWKLVKPTELAGRPANEEGIKNILYDLNHLQATRLIAEKATDKELAEKYGLKPAPTRVTITRNRDNKPAAFVYEFGKEVPTNKADRYARQVFPREEGQREMIFTVDWAKLQPHLETTLQDLTLFQFKPEDVRGLKLTGWAKIIRLTIELESADGKTWKVKKGPEGFQVNSGKVAGLIAYLSKVKAEKIVALGAADKPEYGLDPKGDEALTLEFTVKDGKEPLTLTTGKVTDGGLFARASTYGKDVLLIPSAELDALRQAPNWLTK
jgi:hypothetical protein